MIDIYDLEVSPKVFAKLLGASVTKLAQGKVPEEKVRALELQLRELRSETRLDVEDWLLSRLPVEDADVRPIDVWRYGADPEALMETPVEELDRVCPSWRLLYYNQKGVPSS